MVSKNMKKELAHYKRRSCLCKKKYNKLDSFIRLLILKFRKNGTPTLYKCLFGDHYHVGNRKKYTIRNVKHFSKILLEVKIDKELRQLGVVR